MIHTSDSADPHNLQRFIDAQDSTFEKALTELRAGQKESHWMWFVFPQIQGLGSSSMAKRFAIGSLSEAIAYLEQPVLGTRLIECTNLVNGIAERSVHSVFGYPDDLKFHSSITLFALVTQQFNFDTQVFSDAIAKHFKGKFDEGTLQQLAILQSGSKAR